MKLTRRELVQAALIPATLAQTPPTSGDWLTQAREQTKRNSEGLAKVAVPMATEPAFVFKA